MEVLLVLVILSVLIALVAPGLMGVQKQSFIDAAKVSIKGLEQSLKRYQLNHDGNFPETGDGLQALITAPSNDKKWKGPYLDDTDTLPQDPWGNPFQYEYPGSNHPDGYKADIWSWGPDGQDGTEDDIDNWTVDPK